MGFNALCQRSFLRMPRLLQLLLCLLPTAAMAAEEEQPPMLIWRAAGTEGGAIDAVLGGVTLAPAAVGVFVDTRVHRIGRERFRAIYQVFDSNASNPMGRCGAGREIDLFVYELTPPKPIERGRILISSCLESVFLASQNSGSPDSDSDFSSVIWQDDGFTIEGWDIGSGASASRHYILRNGHFVPTHSGEGNR